MKFKQIEMVQFVAQPINHQLYQVPQIYEFQCVNLTQGILLRTLM